MTLVARELPEGLRIDTFTTMTGSTLRATDLRKANTVIINIPRGRSVSEIREAAVSFLMSMREDVE